MIHTVMLQILLGICASVVAVRNIGMMILAILDLILM